MTSAKYWWAHRKVLTYYKQAQPWTPALVDAVVASEPGRVVEFGCNAGRNLRAIRERDPRIELVGIDVNATAVEWGRRNWGLDLRVGDESLLELDAYDLAFTVSVIDHIPEPEAAIAAIVKAAPLVILVEPWLGHEGHVESHNPYTYSWDYATRLRALGMSVTVRKFPLSDASIGPEYRMFRAKRK